MPSPGFTTSPFSVYFTSGAKGALQAQWETRASKYLSTNPFRQVRSQGVELAGFTGAGKYTSDFPSSGPAKLGDAIPQTAVHKATSSARFAKALDMMVSGPICRKPAER